MGKSVKHKGENTFRFQTFSERIANINIDVIHQIKQQEETPGETGTYFYQSLENWVELNCTKHFTDFYHQVYDKVQTFPQLVHHEVYNFFYPLLHMHAKITVKVKYLLVVISILLIPVQTGLLPLSVIHQQILNTA